MKTSPQKRKQQQNDMQAARGRLRGALNDTLHGTAGEDGTDGYDDGDTEDNGAEDDKTGSLAQRGRPSKTVHSPRGTRQTSQSPPLGILSLSKRRKREQQLNSAGSGAAVQAQKIQAESFVMKLFDRSLDLSKYTEQTSLYPICRAWMANQPRNPSIRSYREQRSPSPVERKDNGEEQLQQLRCGELYEVRAMPAPKSTFLKKVPTQKIPKKFESSEEVVPPDHRLRDAGIKDLLDDHLSKWKQIKSDWQKHSKTYQQRNELNFLIIQELFKP